MLSKQHALAFAEDWIAAWNAHDLERILAHYEDDFSMSSPVIAKLMGISSGTLIGKANVRSYWAKALAANPALQFSLQSILMGSNSVTLIYEGVSGLCAEVLCFGQSGKVASASTHYVLKH